MASPDRPGPAQRDGPDAGRERTVARLRERAAGQARALVTGEDWAAILHLAARLPGWSFTNVLLIAAQRPGATAVAGYEAWQARGRHVRKREPGIQVIAEPGPSTGMPSSHGAAVGGSAARRTASGARTARRTYVWDITQTDGPAADPALPLSPERGAPPGLWEALTWLARREGFAVERAPGDPADSLTSWTTRRILVRSGLEGPDTARALIHELGHVLVHGGLVHPPGISTAGCRGIQKVEADSVAFAMSTRLDMDTSAWLLPYVTSWAGSDPRAPREQTILSTGERITAAATTIAAHLDVALFTKPSMEAVPVLARTREVAASAGTLLAGAIAAQIPDNVIRAAAEPATAGEPPALDIGRILIDAEQFYLDHLERSWVPGYLAARGLSHAALARWRIGYAPHGWTALLSHLHHLGHNDALIEAAGLARRSSRGTLIDHFRDRVMLAIRDEHGAIAGFIGRAHPQAGPAVPKYLNSPETSTYTKGDLLFGLHEARGQLARGAMPVIVEGPFDAIAVTTADPSRFAGLAPCGTALTGRQVTALGRVADLRQTGVLVALDGDRAGREAAIRAYSVLHEITGKITAVILPAGRDPAEILQADGPGALRIVLERRTQPLARVVIDAHLDAWAHQLDHPEGRLHAMRSAASLIASLLPPANAEQIVQATGGQHLATLDDDLHPVESPELSVVARTLPASAACQIACVADRLEREYSEVIAEVANAVSKKLVYPKQAAACGYRNDVSRRQIARADTSPARLVMNGFPAQPHVAGSVTAGPASGPSPAAIPCERGIRGKAFR